MNPKAVDPLKTAAYCAYLISWLVFAVAAIVGALPKLRDHTAAEQAASIKAPVIIGTLLQVFAVFATTRLMPIGALHPQTFELIGALLLAPFGAAIFVWALRSASGNRGLVTSGAYQWLRHPIYLAFLALLLATGFLISAGPRLLLPALLYLGGLELRIDSEEQELSERYPDDFALYRRRTRWRYLPGLR